MLPRPGIDGRKRRCLESGEAGVGRSGIVDGLPLPMQLLSTDSASNVTGKLEVEASLVESRRALMHSGGTRTTIIRKVIDHDLLALLCCKTSRGTKLLAFLCATSGTASMDRCVLEVALGQRNQYLHSSPTRYDKHTTDCSTIWLTRW